MSFAKYDFMSKGPNVYLPVEQWNDINYPMAEDVPAGITCLEMAFWGNGIKEQINSLFEHLYYKYKVLDSTGAEVETVADCGVDADQILKDFIALYGMRPLLRPYYPENYRGTWQSVNKVNSIMQEILDMNSYKYRKLAATLGFSYNPIENYSMVENEAKGAIDEGKEQLSHNVDGNKVGSIEVQTPLSALSLGKDSDGQYYVSDLTADLDYKSGYSEKSATDLEAGQKTDMGDTPSLVNGATQTTKNYTTTMDDASTGRLHNYSETLGTTGQASNLKSEQDIPAVAKIISGAPNNPDYTDTREYLDRTHEEARELSRAGNIGVTTSQQMLDQERQIVRYSLIKEFLEDVAAQICLSVYY